MTYETAKQLKDSGFPQQECKHEFCAEVCIGLYAPTLEELVEAVGTKFFRLTRIHDKWDAEGHGIAISLGHEIGSTPTEAVAKLWLALNGGQLKNPDNVGV